MQALSYIESTSFQLLVIINWIKKRAYLKCPCSGRRHRKPETQYKSLITKPESLEKVNPKLQSIYQSDIPLVFLY